MVNFIDPTFLSLSKSLRFILITEINPKKLVFNQVNSFKNDENLRQNGRNFQSRSIQTTRNFHILNFLFYRYHFWAPSIVHFCV